MPPPAPPPAVDRSGSTAGTATLDKHVSGGKGGNVSLEDPPRRRASTGPTLTIPGAEPYFEAAPGLVRRMSTFGGSGIGSGGLGGASVPASSIDMSDLNNLVCLIFVFNRHIHKIVPYRTGESSKKESGGCCFSWS